MFPIEDEGLRDRVIDEILGIALKDNVKARRLLPDGTLRARGSPRRRRRRQPTETAVRSQYRFMELAREKAQAGPPLPGTGGTYHVRPTPPTRTGARYATAPRRPPRDVVRRRRDGPTARDDGRLNKSVEFGRIMTVMRCFASPPSPGRRLSVWCMTLTRRPRALAGAGARSARPW